MDWNEDDIFGDELPAEPQPAAPVKKPKRLSRAVLATKSYEALQLHLVWARDCAFCALGDDCRGLDWIGLTACHLSKLLLMRLHNLAGMLAPNIIEI